MPAELNRILRTIKELDIKYEGANDINNYILHAMLDT